MSSLLILTFPVIVPNNKNMSVLSNTNSSFFIGHLPLSGIQLTFNRQSQHMYPVLLRVLGDFNLPSGEQYRSSRQSRHSNICKIANF